MTTSITILRLLAYRAIDDAAGEVRKLYITDVAGQQAVYLEKRTEAALYLAAIQTTPQTAVAGPHLTAESAATNVTPLRTAQIVLAQSASWLGTLSPAIEAARVGGKYQVGLCTTPEEVEGAKNAAIAALLAIGGAA